MTMNGVCYHLILSKWVISGSSKPPFVAMAVVLIGEWGLFCYPEQHLTIAGN